MTDSGAQAAAPRPSTVRKVALAAMAGSAIEWYDFFIYLTAAALVFGPLFFPGASEVAAVLASFSTAAVGFVARPVGGILFGHFGDKLGRKPTMVIALLTMGTGAIYAYCIDLPVLYGAADVFAMLCRNRWAGLEQEGFGMVFLEAAACGVPQVAGDSGGAAEAVEHDVTGLVVDRPGSADAVAAALARLLDDDDLRQRMGRAARVRAVADLSHDVLAERLGKLLAHW